MKRFCSLLIFFALLFSGPFTAPAKGQTGCSAQAAVVIEAASGTVLYEKNADQILPEASTTKIMTALLVLESADPETITEISAHAAAVEGSQLGLAEGDRLSVQDLLLILMMKSGNDAAVALAEAVCGSEKAFVNQMNRKAEELGLKNTQFRNPHGLPDPEHYTTARDLAQLTAEAMENEAFRTLVSTQKAKLTYKNIVLANSNKLLYTCEGVCGVKTGFTKAAGRCLVSAAERKNVRLICVTLNDPDDWQDHAALYDQCFPRVSRTVLIPQGSYKTTVPTLNGTDAAAVRNTLPLSVITIDGEPIDHTVTESLPPMVFAPIEKDRTLGYLTLTSACGRKIAASPLSTSSDTLQKIEEQTFRRSFRIHFRRIWKTLMQGAF